MAAEFDLELFDWNKIEQAKSLGVGKIELADLEPFQQVERIIPLRSDKHGEKGEVRIRMKFEPQIIAKVRKGTTFASAGRALTSVGAVPFGATKGLVQGAKGLFVKKGNDVREEDEEGFVVADPPAAQVSQEAGTSVNGTTPFPTSTLGSGTPPLQVGTLRVLVVGAKDLSGPVPGEAVKPYVVLKLGEREHKTKHTGKTNSPEWYVQSNQCNLELAPTFSLTSRHENFSYIVGPDTKILSAQVFTRHTFGKDNLIGETEIDVRSSLRSV